MPRLPVVSIQSTRASGTTFNRNQVSPDAFGARQGRAIANPGEDAGRAGSQAVAIATDNQRQNNEDELGRLDLEYKVQVRHRRRGSTPSAKWPHIAGYWAVLPRKTGWYRCGSLRDRPASRSGTGYRKSDLYGVWLSLSYRRRIDHRQSVRLTFAPGGLTARSVARDSWQRKTTANCSGDFAPSAPHCPGFPERGRGCGFVPVRVLGPGGGLWRHRIVSGGTDGSSDRSCHRWSGSAGFGSDPVPARVTRKMAVLPSPDRPRLRGGGGDCRPRGAPDRAKRSRWLGVGRGFWIACDLMAWRHDLGLPACSRSADRGSPPLDDPLHRPDLCRGDLAPLSAHVLRERLQLRRRSTLAGMGLLGAEPDHRGTLAGAVGETACRCLACRSRKDAI